MPQLFLPKYVESDALDQFMEATYERMISNGKQILHPIVKLGSSGTSRIGEEKWFLRRSIRRVAFLLLDQAKALAWSISRDSLTPRSTDSS